MGSTTTTCRPELPREDSLEDRATISDTCCITLMYVGNQDTDLPD